MRTCKPIDANSCLFIVTTSRPKASWKSTCGRIPDDAAVAGEDGALTEHGEATREAGPRWRRMAGASGPRAAGRAGAPRSPSRCRRRRRRTAPRPSPRRPPGTGGTGPRSWWSTTNPGHERRRDGRLGGTGPRSWWSTTTRTRGARCATLAAAGYAPALEPEVASRRELLLDRPIDQLTRFTLLPSAVPIAQPPAGERSPAVRVQWWAPCPRTEVGMLAHGPASYWLRSPANRSSPPWSSQRNPDPPPGGLRCHVVRSSRT